MVQRITTSKRRVDMTRHILLLVVFRLYERMHHRLVRRVWLYKQTLDGTNEIINLEVPWQCTFSISEMEETHYQ